MVNAMIANTKPPIKFVEYIQNTTTQWFDLGVPASFDYGFRVKANIAQGAGNDFFLGEIANPYRFGMGLYKSNGIVFFSGNGYRLDFVSYKPTIGVDYFINFNYKASGSVRMEDANGTLLGVEQYFGSINNPALSGLNMRLLSLGGSNGVFPYATIYSLEITHDNKIIHDYKPAVRRSDGVAGLYDTITGNFLTNAGIGSFIAGPDI